jgi:hypothetical protein
MARKYIRDNRGRFAHVPGTIASIPGRHAFGAVTVDTSAPASFRKSGVAGAAGLKRNFKPYVRVNKRSQTIGWNTGTRVTGRTSRVSTGWYVRREQTAKYTGLDKLVNRGFTSRAGRAVIPKGSKRAGAVAAIRTHVHVSTPAVRVQFGQRVNSEGKVVKRGVQARLGTARPYGKSRTGPTLVITRGTHKTSALRSFKGMQKYDNRMSQIAGKKAGKAKRPRRQRRRAARRK